MTAGYSGTPLATKLGIKEGMTVFAVDAPADYLQLLKLLPDGVALAEVSAEALTNGSIIARDVGLVHLFTNTHDGLFQGLSVAKKMIAQNGAIWVSWYKKAAKLPTEITEDTVREAALPMGLVDVKVCAVDDEWSGLKLVIRREHRS